MFQPVLIKVYDDEKSYRADSEALNYSRLKWFDKKTPLSYRKKFILGDNSEEDENDGMKNGSLVDLKLLTNEDFETRYHISSATKMPGEKGKALVDKLMELTSKYTDESGTLTVEFVDMFKEAYEVCPVGNSKVDTYLAKFEGSTEEAYYIALREGFGKIVISLNEVEQADRCVNLLRTDENTRDLFNCEGINQLGIKYEYEGTLYRTLFDRVITNHRDKTIGFYDVKTSYKSSNFSWPFLDQRYYIQQGLYELAGIAYRDAIYPDYEIINPFSFITIEGSGFERPLVWRFDFKNPMEGPWNGFTVGKKYYRGINEIVSAINWHTKTDQWMITKEHYDLKGQINYTFE